MDVDMSLCVVRESKGRRTLLEVEKDYPLERDYSLFAQFDPDVFRGWLIGDAHCKLKMLPKGLQFSYFGQIQPYTASVTAEEIGSISIQSIKNPCNYMTLQRFLKCPSNMPVIVFWH